MGNVWHCCNKGEVKSAVSLYVALLCQTSSLRKLIKNKTQRLNPQENKLYIYKLYVKRNFLKSKNK